MRSVSRDILIRYGFMPFALASFIHFDSICHLIWLSMDAFD